MKSQFAHFKNRAKGTGIRGLAIVLCFVMLLTAIGAGTMMTAFSAKADLTGSTAIVDTAQKVVDIANSVDTEADDGIIPKITKKIADLADTGAKADLAETGDTTYYYHYGTGNDYWSSNGIAMTKDGTTWYADIPFTTQYDNFVRVNTTPNSINTSNTTSVSTSYTNNYSEVVNKISYSENVNSGYPGYKIELKTAPSSSTTVRVSFSTSDMNTLIVSSPSGSGSGSGSGSSENGYSLSSIYFKANTSGGWYWSENNARVKAKVTYSDNTTLEAYMTEIPGTSTSIRVLPIDSSKQATKVQFYRKAADDDSDTWATSNEVTIESGKNYFKQPETPTGWNSWDPVQDTYSEFTGDLPAVLDGTKVMFYFGDNYKSGSHAKTLNTKSGATVTHVLEEERPLMCDDSAWTSYYLKYYQSNGTLSAADYEPAVACVSSQKYYISNNTTWEGRQMAENAAAGKAYYATSNGVSTGQARGGATFSNSSYSITQGTATSGISATATYSTSAINETNRVFYAIKKDGESAYYVFNPNNASNLSTGTYTVYAIVADGGLLVKGATATLTVNTPTYYDVTVKSNNSRLGTGTPSPASAYAGQTVTININENMGAINTVTATDASSNNITVSGSGTTRTFTMPSSAVTVNLTFDEYAEESDFYYNGYETDGEESGSFYAKRMTEGKINGQEFSYYHVDGRTGNDQLFTISKKNPAHNSTVFFRTPESWNDDYGWDSGIQAQFFSSDNVQLKDWAWMTFDKNYGNGDKVYKISVPYGARKVQFRGTKDYGSSGWPYTIICDLDWTSSDNGDCFYLKSSAKDGNNFSDIGECNIGNQGKVIPDSFYEYFNGDGIYTNHWSTSGFNNHNANHTGSHSYTKPSGLGANANDYYILVLYSGKTYTINGVEHTADKDPEVIWSPTLPGTEDIDSAEVAIYGKDGSIVIDWNNKGSSGATDSSGTAYGYSIIADTKLYEGSTHIGKDVDDDGASYETATAVVTSEDSYDITIKTEIASAYRDKYYLKGWCIDGVTYACGTNVTGVNASDAGNNGLYEMVYTIPKGTKDGTKIEVTPIYYLKNNTDCVTFYLEGYNTIQSKWGNTPYIYPFYGDLNNVDNSFGVYPGQPMVYADGKYSVEIPMTNTPIIKASSATKIKGITINNGYADHVHRNLIYKWTAADNDMAHKQTYDYDDFYKIYNECTTNAAGEEAGHPNSIIFRIQDEETVNNRAVYGGGKSGQFASGTSDININTIASSGNGWELLVNRYDQAVNIFGSTTNITKPAANVTPQADTANALYVVSTGYNANIAGDYGTMWKVYDGSGKLISTDTTNSRYGIPPSVLVMKGSVSGITNKTGVYPTAAHSVDGVGSYTDSISKYEGIYKKLQGESYVGKRVYITYEQDAQDTRSDSSGTGAYRLDGRWYYTHSNDMVSSTIGIEYWDQAQGKWLPDTVAAGTGLGGSGNTAKFDSDSYASENTVTTSNEKVINAKGTWNFTATPGSGYKFDSWQIKYSGTSYDPIAGAKESASIGATANYQLIARFMPTVTGSLTITHKLNSASTGEGTVALSASVGSTNYTGTVIDGVARIHISDGINNESSQNITITLTATPTYDGKVTAFGYDTFNSKNNITATTNPADLANATENGETTSTFTIPVSSLFTNAAQSTSTLDYTSVINETIHYYDFDYSFTDRSGTSKTYTAKGEISQKDYKAYITNAANHTLDNSILVAKAPFESNFLKKNTLTKGAISYNSSNHTFSATSTFDQADDVPTYHVVFKLPYGYYASGDGSTIKKYTYNGSAYNADQATFDLAAKYNTFVTINATSAEPDTTQAKCEKVTDSSDINHFGNNFITAPEEIGSMFFKYWEIKRLKSDNTAGEVIARIYFPDFHYRVYTNYYVEAVYSNDPQDSWKFNYNEDVNDQLNDIRCSVMYLGDSRNQWNNGTGATSSNATDAADKIYSDFIFNYVYNGKELKGSDAAEIGMIIERATYMDTTENKAKWLMGSSSVTDMDSYRASYGGNQAASTESTRSSAIRDALNAGSTLPNGTVKITWNTNDLNNKNFLEQSYSAFSRYGQTVDAHSISFATDNTIDNYVYRAYAYIKVGNEYTLSDPAYFCMRYTSNLKYTE